MDRYICVHGHFYQPPRENPWRGEIEEQPSAAPWHDWNERIADECYAPNTDAPVGREDDEGHPITLNTFSRISFDTGPTLLSWLERSRPGILEAIREADRSGRERFSGHGPAMAQAYNHLIQPLADSRDRQTQILWGISDFRHRFGRDPQGLWLPETAVDIESLDLMAAAGVRFTILASHQAAVEEPIDPTLPYLVRLPSGREMSVFFYDDELGNAVSFGGLLNDREVFLRTLLDRGIPGSDLETDADSDPDQPRLIHLATDGETFGHHVKGGEETLAWTLDQLERGGEAELTIYGEYLERFPATREIGIKENSSWSCPHGVERWRSDCGCSGGRLSDGSHAWRAPLREALDWLRDSAADLFVRETEPLLVDPWRARDEYINVILDRSEKTVSRFLDEQTRPEIPPEGARKVLPLLELQRNAMLMYTSCGWFFDDPGDLETVQILQYAGMVIQIAARETGTDLEGGFLSILEEVESNDPERGSGAAIYERHVRPNLAGPDQEGES